MQRKVSISLCLIFQEGIWQLFLEFTTWMIVLFARIFALLPASRFSSNAQFSMLYSSAMKGILRNFLISSNRHDVLKSYKELMAFSSYFDQF
jgi:hypothetical protein